MEAADSGGRQHRRYLVQQPVFHTRLPFDQVKIDQPFVREVTEDQSDAAIVRAIMAMSRSLGLQLIAEGMETLAQRDFLLRNECRACRGFLFCGPLSIGDWGRLLK